MSAAGRRLWKSGDLASKSRDLAEHAHRRAEEAIAYVDDSDGLLSDFFLGVEESEGMLFSSPDVRFGANANQSSGRTADDLLSGYEEAYGQPTSLPVWGSRR